MPEKCPRKHKHNAERMKTATWDLRIELNREAEALMRAQHEITELKNPITHLEF